MKPRFMYPAHPDKKLKISAEQLDYYEGVGVWIAQRKFNGSHAIIWVYQDQIQIWNRNGEPFSTYHLTESMRKCFLQDLNVEYDTEYVFDGELLHTKAKLKSTGKQAAENVIVLFDILYAGKYLTGMNTMERLDLLHKIAPSTTLEPKKRALLVASQDESQLWLAETFTDEFSYRFWEMFEHNKNGEDMFPEIEGLILKMKDAKNTSIGNSPHDVLWMIRCRKTKEKMYQL